MITANTGQVTIGNFEIVVTGYSKFKVEEVRYRPFGETLRDTGELSVSHKYTSQEFDAETGLYNYNARFYNPALGRFISADSIVPDPADPQSLNRYGYVLNNPHRYVDPSGHDDTSIDFYVTDWSSSSGSNYDGSGYFNYYDQISSSSFSNSYVPNDSNGSSATSAQVGGNSATWNNPVILTLNYWPSAWGSLTMVWHDSLLPSFYRSGTLGSNGKIALPGIYRYQYGQHPMTPTTDPRTGKLKVPYPALNVYNPLYKLFGRENDRQIPAFNFNTFRPDTIEGQNVHRGNSINSSKCGGTGCLVLPEETWDDFFSNIPPGSSGFYINLGL
jgi:RHS repeat-associated protein